MVELMWALNHLIDFRRASNQPWTYDHTIEWEGFVLGWYSETSNDLSFINTLLNGNLSLEVLDL
jgi:hypothetical protein